MTKRGIDLVLSHNIRHQVLAAKWQLRQLKKMLDLGDGDRAIAQAVSDLEEALARIDRIYSEWVRRAVFPD